jgi:hypothetical protein
MPDREEGDLGTREKPVDRDQQEDQKETGWGIGHEVPTIILSEFR